MAFKLYVGGLSCSTTSDSLRQHFAECGTVESAAVVTDRFSVHCSHHCPNLVLRNPPPSHLALSVPTEIDLHPGRPATTP